jgi:hypothetical protein
LTALHFMASESGCRRALKLFNYQNGLFKR